MSPPSRGKPKRPVCTEGILKGPISRTPPVVCALSHIWGHFFRARQDNRWDYGEDRYQLLGTIEHRVFVVVYTVRGDVIRIISARKANQREVQDYENSTREG